MCSVRQHVILITLTKRLFNTQSNGYVFVISQSTIVTRRHLFVLRKNFFFFTHLSNVALELVHSIKSFVSFVFKKTKTKIDSQKCCLSKKKNISLLCCFRYWESRLKSCCHIQFMHAFFYSAILSKRISLLSTIKGNAIKKFLSIRFPRTDVATLLNLK